ncbi:MAG: MgtC/SapB family protein, partial [Vulcanimicrobiaceae bacterium]
AGVALPLLPNTPIAWLGAITPQRMLLAVVVISALSYFSYLVQTYLKPKGGALIAAALGGLYSSTATTVVLARRAYNGQNIRSERAGIVLATSLMYVRLLLVVAVFNLADAARLLVPLLALFVFSLAIASALYFFAREKSEGEPLALAAGNPLQLGTALTFAVLFVLVTLATQWAQAHYGHTGINILAAIVGFTDIDPFVLSIAQGSVVGMQAGGAAIAILIAAASNDALKALYALIFGGRRQWLAAVALIIIAAATLAAGMFVTSHPM